jgi:beta-galactosidase
MTSMPAPRELSFDRGWRFLRGDVDGAESASFDDSQWRTLDVPHDWSIEDLPHADSDDGAATSYPSVLVYAEGGGPSAPEPPSVIGPFDFAGSEGKRGTGFTVGGVGWYRKRFTLDDYAASARGGESPHVELRFDGIYQNADMWLNGVHLGFHPYGYTSFAYDLTPHLQTLGTNVLAVRVDNSGANSRWYSGSGIYRHTWLAVTGPVRIPMSGLHVTTPSISEQRSTAEVEVSVANLVRSDARSSVRVSVLDPRGHVVATAQGQEKELAAGGRSTETLRLEVERAPLWSPESPALHAARAEVLVDGEVVDVVTVDFGFRSLTWNGTEGILLNGQPITVRGGCVHHDHGPLGAVSLARSEQRRVEILQAAGFNAIRTAHNPPDPALLDICDRLGMLVMDEFVDMWDESKKPDDYSLHFADWWEKDLSAMVLRDRNHPSVIMWSIGNEIPNHEKSDRGRQMAALVRGLDTTRPITLADGHDDTTAPAWDYVDIADVHYQAQGQGYGGMAELHRAHPDKPLTQNESFPATIAEDESFTNEHRWFVGNWVWTAWDYLGESGLGKTLVTEEGAGAALGDKTCAPGFHSALDLYKKQGGYGLDYPYFQANCGDFDLIGQPKPQSRWRSAVWGRSPVELLIQRPVPAGMEQLALRWGYFDELESWTWEVPAGTPMTVHVYTPGDSVRLLLNGIERPELASVRPHHCTATFTVPYQPGTLTAVASSNGREIGRKTLATAGPAAALHLESDVTTLNADPDELAHVLVSVLDSDRRLVPDSVVRVAFELEGPGRLKGVGNGNPHNVDSFQQPRRHTWHGRALAIVQPTGEPGRITLTARSDNLTAAAATLIVR